MRKPPGGPRGPPVFRSYIQRLVAPPPVVFPRIGIRLGPGGGTQTAEIAGHQIRTISKGHLGRRLGKLDDEEATALRRLLTEMYG